MGCIKLTWLAVSSTKSYIRDGLMKFNNSSVCLLIFLCFKKTKQVIYDKTVDKIYESPLRSFGWTRMKVTKMKVENIKSQLKRHIKQHYTSIDFWCRPESIYCIDRGRAEVNVSIIRLTSHYSKCINSQQWFNYIMFLNKNATTTKS